MKRNLNVLLAVINAYEENGEFSHFSGAELNHKFGFATKNIPQMLKDLVDLKYIENHTINGFYNRYKILKHIDCPEFILDNKLSNSQKDFLLRCIEQNITEDLSKKEMARRVNGNENGWNFSRSVDGILEILGEDSLFDIISEFNIVKELKPENAIKTEFGYKTNKNIKRLDSSEKTQDNIIAQFLLKKSSQCRRRRNKVLEYNLTLEYIKELLLKQEYKDYYTGQVPENYEDYSIDRIDSNLGYIEGNIVITTNRVNTMKNDMSTEEFKKLISDIYKNISNF
ncbi:hypothetical protein [Intestinibacter bartlettii]|uniref:hypothetical protein n=1 Tax=Intestinibacter bartlettii TaxID=261299 RepID=UPI0039F5B83C